ncbi:MAG: protein kinase [Planctomycetota bacterium]|nr:protein kinase [Planctomycetota bacterium]
MSTDDELEDRLDELAESFSARLREGETPDIEAYATEHPELAERIRHLFPVLMAMEGAHARSGDELPEAIGPYEIVRRLGQGGMGAVFEARAPSGTTVAIKLVHAHLLGNTDYYRRFLREAEAGMRLDHPGIVRTLELGWTGSKESPRPFLVLEYVEGEDLYSATVKSGPMSERLVRLVGRDVARALGAVHAAGLLHRDVKPENILITPDETIKLMDMGIALQREGVTRLSVTGQFVGSRLYAAPEQLLGGELDERTDLYALGLVLYELLTGQHAWLAPDGTAMDPTARRGVLPRVRDAVPQVSRLMDAVVARLLQTERTDRFDSADEVATILAEGEDSAWWLETGMAESTAETAFPFPEPHVGREGELRRLDALLTRVGSGRGGALVVSGDPGLGRTHLLRVWLARASRSSHHPRCVLAGGAGVGQVSTSLAAAFGEHLGPADLEHRLATMLTGLSAVAGPFADVLRGIESEAARTLTPDARATAFVEVLRALAADGPVLLAFDDLDRASREDQQAFVRIALAARDAPIVVIGITSAEPPAVLVPHLRSDAIQQLALGVLPPSDARSLLRASTQDVDVTERRLDAAAERAGGNPLYLVELGRMLGRDGAAELPDSLQHALEAHLADLDDNARELLDAAACAGPRFDPCWIADALGLPRIRVLRTLDGLARADGFLESAGRLYRFSHRLTHEALLERMHEALRATLHETLAACLADAGDEPKYALPGPRAIVMARHFLAAGQAERIAPYLEEVLRTLDLSRPAEVDALVTAVLESDAEIPAELRVRALCTKGRALITMSRPEEARAACYEATAIATMNPELGTVQLLELEGRLARTSGNLADARAYYERAAEEAQASGQEEAETRCRIAAGVILGNLGHTDEAMRALEAARDRASALGATMAVASATVSLGLLAAESADPSGAEAILREGLEQCLKVGGLRTASRAQAVLAGLLQRRGRMGEALEQLEASLALGMELGDRKHEIISRGNLSETLMELGRIEDATRQAREAVRLAETSDEPIAAAFATANQGWLCVHTGELGEGLRHLVEARDAVEAMGYLGLLRHIVGRLVHAWAVAGQLTQAREALADMTERHGKTVDARWAPHALWVEARLCEAEARYDEAYALHERSRAAAASSADALRALTGMGRTALCTDRPDVAAMHLAEVLDAPDVGIDTSGVLAVALQTKLDAATLEPAVHTLEARAPALPAFDRAEAWYALYEAGGDASHLARATQLLDHMRASLDAADRPAFDAVDLVRRIGAASM